MLLNGTSTKKRKHALDDDEDEILEGSVDDFPESSASLNDDSDESISDGEESRKERAMPEAMREISFGALAEAQDTLDSSHSLASRNDRAGPNEEKISSLRARLAEIKSLKSASKLQGSSLDITSKDKSSTHRSSKHAPRSQSSKYAVTRYRPATTLSANPQNVRDPRFSAVSTHAIVDEDRLRKNYSFLSDYRASEVSELKSVLSNIKLRVKKRKSGQATSVESEELEELKRKINSIENKKKSEDRKERERDVVRRHRRQEREQIKLGKTPFYLKRGEAKKQAEKEKWDSMKGRDKKKLQERREKKRNAKEKVGAPGLAVG